MSMNSHLPLTELKKSLAVINAESLDRRVLNSFIKRVAGNGVGNVRILNVYGQRYIGTGLNSGLEIEVHGTAGNDLGAFMDGPSIVIYGNVQDGCGNTMNTGLIVVHGQAGDVTGYSMRGGKIFIRDNVGYRAGIHMKEFQNTRPFLVVGGSAGDFLGEYMAGGVILVLGLNWPHRREFTARFVGTGMHGGLIYMRGEMRHLGTGAEISDVDEDDMDQIGELVKEFCCHFGFDSDRIMESTFTKMIPSSRRPYGNLYAR